MSGKTIDDDDSDTGIPSLMSPKQFNSYLMKKIIDFWGDRGHPIRVWAQPVSLAKDSSLVWEIKSDLRNGMPPKVVKEDVYGDAKRVLSPPLP